jgi:hypothetical protein
MDIGEVLRERVGLKGTGLGVFGMRIVMMVGIQMRNLGYLIPALGKALGRRSVSGLEVVREVLVNTVRNPGVQERVVRGRGFRGHGGYGEQPDWVVKMREDMDKHAQEMREHARKMAEEMRKRHRGGSGGWETGGGGGSSETEEGSPRGGRSGSRGGFRGWRGGRGDRVRGETGDHDTESGGALNEAGKKDYESGSKGGKSGGGKDDADESGYRLGKDNW